MTEVELAVREASTSYGEMLNGYQSLMASEAEEQYLEARWWEVPASDTLTTELLDDLFDAQERRADAEARFVRSQVDYVTSLARVRQSMGTLLKYEYGLPLAAQAQDDAWSNDEYSPGVEGTAPEEFRGAEPTPLRSDEFPLPPREPGPDEVLRSPTGVPEADLPPEPAPVRDPAVQPTSGRLPRSGESSPHPSRPGTQLWDAISNRLQRR
ncbi:MAG: hypothetical protein R3B90_17965 [Planctomycetaceae bacterium]